MKPKSRKEILDICQDNFLSYYSGKAWHKILPAVDGTTITYNDDNKLTTIAFNAGNGIDIDDRGISVKKSNQPLAFIRVLWWL